MLAVVFHPLIVLIRSFRASSLPVMSRPCYRWELLSAGFMPMALACVEGGVIGVIAVKAFDASNLIVAALAASAPVANLTSVLWTRLLHGHDRVRSVVALQMALLACVAGIALTPSGRGGPAMLVALVMSARAFMTGLYTARSDIWRSNYPRSARAKATGKLTIMVSAVSSVSALVIAWAMDVFDGSSLSAFRPLYLAAAALGLIGVWAFGHIRWRGRASLIARERKHPSEGGAVTPTPLSMIKVLRHDGAYRKFMIAQFVLGMAQLAGIAPFTIAVTRDMHLGYGPAIALTFAIPFLAPMFAIPFWSKFLDRTHIVRFRVYHSWVFVAANALTAVALLVTSVPLLFVARLILGVGYGGGRLAWTLGHYDFAPRGMVSIYMGIHITLTGVRGVMAPFVGAMIYSGLRFHTPLGDVAWSGIGGWAFAVFALVNVAASVLFARLQSDLVSGRYSINSLDAPSEQEQRL